MMSAFELDHLFIATRPDAPGLEDVLAIGVLEGTRNVHPGQGTANRRIFFHNVMLEFLWITDPAEVRSAPIAPTHLAERCDPARNDGCPFGICIRPTGADPAALPFDTWAYRPPYLPAALSIPVATNAGMLHEPFIFAIAFGGRPDAAPPERRQPIDHPAGLREVTKVTLSLPPFGAFSPALRYLVDSGIVDIQPAAKAAIALEFDHVAARKSASFAPRLPLTFHW